MRCLLTWMLICCAAPVSVAQEHSHGDHGDHQHGAETPAVEPPTVFLDKSPRIVEYQLKRLDNQRLLLVERETSDAKYAPVYSAILTRVGMSPQYRQESVEALSKLNEISEVEVLLDAITGLDLQESEEQRVARELARMLLRQPPQALKARSEVLEEALQEDEPLMRAIAAAAMIVSGQQDAVTSQLEGNRDLQSALLDAVALIPSQQKRDAMRDAVVDLLESSEATSVRRDAVRALGFIRSGGEQTFELVAPLVGDDAVRQTAINTLLKIPADKRDVEVSEKVARELVKYAEETPAEDRTSAAFVEAMQLADQMLAIVPSDVSRPLRDRLSEVTVRLVRIKTVEEEMRYDIAYFAVEAGKQVQIVLENHDLMPHNLVITVPGALKEVAQEGLQVGPSGGESGLAYVPVSDKVLHATPPVNVDKSERLTFTAPEEPGEYPYVCTFPQHWYRMYGVMVVVEDLDAWLKDPVEPANPIGSNRSFVQAWTVDDLKDELDAGMRGRSPEIGQKIFAEASCAGCHKIDGQGGIIGPELTDVMQRWKGDRVGVLREILEPSHKVDAKYVMQRVLTVDGRTVTGVLLKEDDDNVTLMTNPEAKEPMVIPQDDIEVMVPSSVSMMPKALMDQYTKDEIFELMAYLEHVGKEN